MNTIIEKIRAEVLRIIRESDCSQWGLGKMSACNRILKFLDTLQEQQEVDLDNKTIMEEIRKLGCYPSEFDVARRFYELGLAEKEKQMMKEAVEGIAVINANAKEDGFGYVRSDYVSDDVLRGLGNFKLIIVKEEGK